MIRSMLAESLRGVVAQTLFSRADGQGRVAAYEIMRNTKAISNLVREGKVHQIPSAMQTGATQGMVLFEKYIEDLVRKGKVSAADAKTFLGQAGGGDTSVQPGATMAGGTPRTKVG